MRGRTYQFQYIQTTLTHGNMTPIGKTEIWYIIDCSPDAYLYYGFSMDVTLEEFESAIANNILCTMLIG